MIKLSISSVKSLVRSGYGAIMIVTGPFLRGLLLFDGEVGAADTQAWHQETPRPRGRSQDRRPPENGLNSCANQNLFETHRRIKTCCVVLLLWVSLTPRSPTCGWGPQPEGNSSNYSRPFPSRPERRTPTAWFGESEATAWFRMDWFLADYKSSFSTSTIDRPWFVSCHSTIQHTVW